MMCTECSCDYPETEFLMKNPICYHCVYSKKLKLLGNEKKTNGFCCKVCKGMFEVDKNKKIRQRNVYCSSKCASEAHKEQMQNFWTNKITLRLGFS